MQRREESGDRVAIVTGGGAGLGRAVVLGLVKQGVQVLALDRDEASLQATLQAARHLPGRVEPHLLDLTDVAAIERLFALEFSGGRRLDILVNNAGISQQTPFLDMSRQEWDSILAVNLTAVFDLTQRAARAMLSAIEAGRQPGGRIVNIASIAGLRGIAGRAAYATSKGGIIALTKELAVELGPLGITVNAVAPGPVDTSLTLRVHTEATREAYNRSIPLARYGLPEEIAAGVLFLCSPAASYVNGHTLPVDGGFASTGMMFDPR